MRGPLGLDDSAAATTDVGPGSGGSSGGRGGRSTTVRAVGRHDGESETRSTPLTLVEDRIIQILTSPEAAAIMFSYAPMPPDGSSRGGGGSSDPIQVYGSGYRHVAEAIRNRRILVLENSDLHHMAAYTNDPDRPEFNRIFVPTDGFPANVLEDSLVVHEATHGIQDWHRRPLTSGDSEVGAYIAQCFYLINRGVSQSQFPSFASPTGAPDPALRDVFVNAWMAAEIFRTNPGESGEAVAYVIDQIRAALDRTAEYGGRLRQMRSWNGL